MEITAVHFFGLGKDVESKEEYLTLLEMMCDLGEKGKFITTGPSSA